MLEYIVLSVIVLHFFKTRHEGTLNTPLFCCLGKTINIVFQFVILHLT